MITYIKGSLRAAKGDISIGTMRKVLKKLADKERSPYVIRRSNMGLAQESIAVSTIHAVKGETHDLTVVVCPNPSSDEKCPSRLWWANDGGNQEERRIAYVALTRSRGDVLLCVSEATSNNLHRDRPEFVAACTCMSIAEYVAST
jgi:superfamily I DNA/RNA helicase